MATVLPAGTSKLMPFRIGRGRHRSGTRRRRSGRAAVDDERLRVGLVDDLRRHVEEIEHRLDVDQPLLDLAVDEADEVERDRQLHEQRVDQDEIADGLLAAHDGGPT
jgi:hypothetical protein